MKRHRWTNVSKVSAGRYEATPAAFTRIGLYPAKCDDCRALISVARRPSKRGGQRVEVEVFSTDGGATWAEARPACERGRANIHAEPARDRGLHSEAARERKQT